MVELAMASYLSLYPALLFPPLLMLTQKRQPKVRFLLQTIPNIGLNS
jgi:hypothetical protein